MQRYQAKLSGPFLDRIQLRARIDRPAHPFDRETERDEEDSASVRQRVAAARQRQQIRGALCNAELPARAVREWCAPDAAGVTLLNRAASRFALSMRACEDALRVARTIADLAGAQTVREHDVAEALALRGASVI